MSDETTYDAQIVVKREEWTRTDQDFRPEAVALGDRPLFKAVVTKDGQRFALRQTAAPGPRAHARPASRSLRAAL